MLTKIKLKKIFQILIDIIKNEIYVSYHAKQEKSQL